MGSHGYVLITSAYNEERFIEGVVEAVVAQTVPPATWFIVDDGSSDSTGELILRAAERHGFVRFLRRPPSRKLGYLSKVEALNEALSPALNLEHPFVGILDADVSMPPTYFEELLQRFAHDRRLGVGGGSVFFRDGDRYMRHRVARNSISGAVQFFRTEVLRAVAPFRPFRHGGEDAACTILARADGWRTQHFPDLRVYHHRPVGLGPGATYAAKRFRQGMMFYDLGYAPEFHVARAVGRCLEPPALLGTIIEISGYVRGVLHQQPPLLPKYAVRYLRGEQRRRLLGRSIWRRFGTAKQTSSVNDSDYPVIPAPQ